MSKLINSVPWKQPDVLYFLCAHFCVLRKAQACVSIINIKLLRVLCHRSSGH